VTEAVRIRDADPGDVRFLAWVMQEAARSHLERGIWDFAFPDASLRIDFLAALAAAEGRSFFHHAGFLVAEIDGRAAAALSGYEPRLALGPALAEANLEAIRRVGMDAAEAAAYGERMQTMSRAMPDTPEERWIVEWVATLPEFRGRGLADQLLHAILARGRERGYRGAQIGYLIGNTPASRVYERVGFKGVDEKRDAAFEEALGCPGIARMHLDL
jgi:ribosomal protein S18 acetylase RimI-like enzyme